MSPELEQFVQQEVASGRFSDREAFIAHAVRIVQVDREETIAGIQAGLDDMAAGRVEPLAEAIASIRRKVKSSNAK